MSQQTRNYRGDKGSATVGIATAVLLALPTAGTARTAIAHEIGHLLLNNAHHSSAGLMRAVWSAFELQRNNTADWLFRKEEAATMREAVAARCDAAR